MNFTFIFYLFLDPKSEDDGVLITIVFDGEKSKSYLVIIDAITFEPIARSYLPHNIPWSAHGMHFPEATFGENSQHGRRTSKDELWNKASDFL